MKHTLLRKVICAIICLSMTVSIIAGCGQSDKTDMSKSVKNTGSISNSDTSSGHEPLTIVTGQQYYGDFVELLKERHPEVELEFISVTGGNTSGYMLESLKAGDIPDIYTITYVPDGELQSEHLLDMSIYSVVNKYPGTMLDRLNVGGGIYLLPSTYSLLGIVYNKTIMTEEGWEVPKSFEELLELAPKIEAAGYQVMDLRSSLTGTTFGAFFALGSTNYFYTPEGAQWKTDFLKGRATAVGAIEEAADYFQEWIDAGFISTYYYDNPSESVSTDFSNRKYVFQLYSNSMPSNTADEYGFMPFLSKDGSNNMLTSLVSRYYGINKELGEPGNEQKLEDAMKVLDLMATKEGQEALSGKSTNIVPSVSIEELPEGSLYRDVAELIKRGSMIDMVYGGWEDYIVPLIEDYGNPWIKGEITKEEFLAGMDELNTKLLAGNKEDTIGVASEAISYLDTARLCAIAEGKAADADAALVVLRGFHGFANGANLESRYGVNNGIYEGNISKPVSLFVTESQKLLKVKLTGKEIKTLAETGYYIEGDPTPYDYCMVTKNNISLEDEQEYILAVSEQELSNTDILAKAEDTGIAPAQAIINYIMELGTVNSKTIVWE